MVYTVIVDLLAADSSARPLLLRHSDIRHPPNLLVIDLNIYLYNTRLRKLVSYTLIHCTCTV